MPKELTGKAALKLFNETLENCDWVEGYQLRHSEYFFIRNLNTQLITSNKRIIVSFTLEYKTKAHKVINNVQWSYPYSASKQLAANIEQLELEVLTKTSDPDVTNQVFGKRFNKVLFEEQKLGLKGWIIKR